MSFTVWFTGLSGSGKTTLSRLVEQRLTALGVPVVRLDGDEMRARPGWCLGFGKRDRILQTLRLGTLARQCNASGTVCLVAAIAPYARARRVVRKMLDKEGGTFVEIYSRADIAVLAQHDLKGLYAKALAGEIQAFTGISDPYEEPQNPEGIVLAYQESLECSADRVMETLRGCLKRMQRCG